MSAIRQRLLPILVLTAAATGAATPAVISVASSAAPVVAVAYSPNTHFYV